MRTNDSFEYPNDDTPSYPIVDLEILPVGDNYFTAIAADTIGSVDNNILSTNSSTGALTATLIQETFFHNSVDLSIYGVEGSAALWVTSPGTQKVSLTVENAENSTLLLWDREKLKPIEVTDGTQSIEVFTVSDEWGFVLLDATDASNNSSVSVDSLQWLSPHPLYNFTEKGDVEADAMANTYTIGTGTKDWGN